MASGSNLGNRELVMAALGIGAGLAFAALFKDWSGHGGRAAGGASADSHGRAAPSPAEAAASAAAAAAQATTEALRSITAELHTLQNHVTELAMDRRRGEAQHVPRTDAELDRLRFEKRVLEAQLQQAVAEPSLRRQRSRTGLDTIEEHELVRMRAIFDLFDTSRSGTIGSEELQRLHEKLGEPISAKEAALALMDMNSMDGQVSFDDFVAWWDRMHRPDPKDGTRRGARYMARFKFLMAKIPNPSLAHVSVKPYGQLPSLEYRLRFYYTSDDGTVTQISPWHDIPLRNLDGSYNMIVEIPKWSRRKFEIATGEEFNPIKQDVKNGMLREYTWGDMMFNYGALPQTWEDPHVVSHDTGFVGDNDPIDCVELGTRSWPTGSVIKVKVLGVLALIDDDETDWKLLAVNVQDPLADKLDCIADLEAHMPGVVAALHDWFRDYKSPIINKFAFDGQAKDREFAEDIISETHSYWQKLRAKAEKKVGMPSVSSSGNLVSLGQSAPRK